MHGQQNIKICLLLLLFVCVCVCVQFLKSELQTPPATNI